MTDKDPIAITAGCLLLFFTNAKIIIPIINTTIAKISKIFYILMSKKNKTKAVAIAKQTESPYPHKYLLSFIE